MKRLVEIVRHAFRQGEISAGDAHVLLGSQYLVDVNGGAWTAGAESGQWYVFRDGGWQLMSQAPADEELVKLGRDVDACPDCGTMLADGFTCPQCGAVTAPALLGADEKTYVNLAEFLILGRGLVPEPITPPWQPPANLPPLGGWAEIVCPDCGRGSPVGSRYCTFCGHPLTEVQEPESTEEAPVIVPIGGQAGNEWWLVMESGPEPARVFPLVARPGITVRIGRSSNNEIQLADGAVSRYHALLEWSKACFVVSDIKSSNGTFVNGNRVKAPVELVDGDVIRIGETIFSIRCAGAELAHSLGMKRPCPVCGVLTGASMRYCTQCGAALDQR